ncbi:MAG TPA: ABC transporter permease [Candidatus Acidoferrales bacterium]|nr:ABC transporter permease [Candidatus Acidoferrales bacterium]
MSTLLQDIRYGLRMLAKAPGFTAVAVITLALGIGANTAIFSVINSALLKPLPFKSPEQLVSLRETESAPGDFPLDGADYMDWQAQNKTFQSMSLFSYGFSMSFSSSGQGLPEPIAAIGTQSNFFETLGVQPLIGRTFAKGEDAKGKDHVAILSYAFWQRRFAGNPDVLGKEVKLNSESYTVVGVMPRWFNYPPANDLWTPFDMTQPLMHNRGSHWASAIGRVKDGVTIEQARADLLTVSARLNKEYRQPNDQDIHSLVFPLKDRLIGDSESQLLVLLGAVALVLLVACANIANLLLARSTGRQREMAVRAALGAGRWRLARQVLTESLLLSLGGTAIGLVAASWGVSLLQTAKRLPIPQINQVTVDGTVLVFAVGLSLLVGVLFGLAPALQTSGLNLSEELKSSANAVVSATGAGRIVRNTLIVAEIAVSLALLVGAGLLMRSFSQMRNAKIGVNSKNVLTLRINLPGPKYSALALEEQFYDQVLARVIKIPGVTSAAVSQEIALQGGSNGYISVPGSTNPALANQLVEYNVITPDYFRVYGIPLLRGRNFTQEDLKRDGETSQKIDDLYRTAKDPSKVTIPPDLSQIAIINEAMAKTFWPNQDPIGKTYKGFGGSGPATIVVGVVGDEQQWGIRHRPIPENYFPLTRGLVGSDGFNGTVSIKTSVAPASILETVRGDVGELDSSLALFHVRTMEEVIADNMQQTTLQTYLLGTFAGLAMLLAAIGLYGVMSYLVTQRTHEIGIRMALGAQRRDVVKLVIGQGAKLILLGVAIGIAAALALTRLMSTLLFGVHATDPLTYVSVAVLLSAVALLACYIPARRAMRVDPMVALRYE